MSQSLPEEMFDVRQIERFLQEGVLTPEQVEAWLASLEDCSANAEQSTIQMVEHEHSRRFAPRDESALEEDEA